MDIKTKIGARIKEIRTEKELTREGKSIKPEMLVRTYLHAIATATN